MNTRRTLATAILAAAIAVKSGAVGITNDTLTLTFNRTGTVTYANTTASQAMAGSVKVLTNCQALVGTATQDLTGVFLNLYVGNSSTNVCFTGCVQNAEAGTFSARITLPPVQAVGGPVADNWAGIVLELTNATDAVTYPDEKRLYIRQRQR